MVQEGEAAAGENAVPSKGSGEYTIGVDDMVKVDVWKNPDLSVEAPVRPDGMITVPLIGDVRAGGKLPSEVAKLISEKLSVYIRKPEVTVILSQLKSHEFISRIRVTGAVNTPSSMAYRQGMTVLDAVLEAGGINKFANANKTRLFRKQGDKSELMPVKLKNILKKGDLETNYRLMPGDVITVPERGF
jgi:polysaccharide export outer membrane protein